MFQYDILHPGIEFFWLITGFLLALVMVLSFWDLALNRAGGRLGGLLAALAALLLTIAGVTIGSML